MILPKNAMSMEYKNLYSETSVPINFPIFQRGYAWKKEQTENLIHDILSLVYETPAMRKNKELYFLDFIWYKELGVKKLADGQQRSVTLNILILCINEYIKNNNLPIKPLNTFNFVYDDEETNEKYRKFFIEEKRTTAPFGNVYKAMTQFIEEYNMYIEDIIDVIKNNIFVYLKQVPDADVAFSVFTQINSGGKPLSKDDVIKTTIRQYSKKYNLPINDYNFKDIKNLIKSYQKLISGSSGNFNNLAIMAFLNSQIVKDKKSFEGFCNYMKMVNDINKHSIYYVIQYINKEQLLSILYALRIQGIDVSSKREYLEKVLLPLCLMSIIWKIKKVNPGGVTASLFVDILNAIKSKKNVNELQKIIMNFVTSYPDTCKISFNEFVKNLGFGLDRQAMKALLIMDIINNNTSGYLNVPAINLEHIYPQNPADEWLLNGWPGNAEEQAELVDNIGNYMLLSEPVNKKVQNKYILDKVIEYDKIIPKDKMLQTPLNTVDFKRFEAEKDVYIIERQEAIAKKIQSSFFFGKMLIV